jgi:hypothetical protein
MSQLVRLTAENIIQRVVYVMDMVDSSILLQKAQELFQQWGMKSKEIAVHHT